MKKTIFYLFLGIVFFSVSAFEMHKFYAAIFQVNYVQEKRMIQITSRIFLDDLSKAIEKKYNKKNNLASEKESTEDINLLNRYISENLVFKVNGQPKAFRFLSKETEGDVLVCYFSIKDISKLKKLEVYNTILSDWNSEQQNIMHFIVSGEKRSTLFTSSHKSEMLNY
jgi:exopolysaccharide biosynthesis protein